jgi:hypothetical protein
MTEERGDLGCLKWAFFSAKRTIGEERIQTEIKTACPIALQQYWKRDFFTKRKRKKEGYKKKERIEKEKEREREVAFRNKGN